MEKGTFVVWFTIGEDADSVRCGYLPSSEAVRDAALEAGGMQLYADIWSTSYTYPTENDHTTYTRQTDGVLYPRYTASDPQPVLQVIPRILDIYSSPRDSFKITLNRNFIQNPAYRRRAFILQYLWGWHKRHFSAINLYGPNDGQDTYRSLFIKEDSIEFAGHDEYADTVMDSIKIWSAPIEGIAPELEWPPGSGNYGPEPPSPYFWRGNIKTIEVL